MTLKSIVSLILLLTLALVNSAGAEPTYVEPRGVGLQEAIDQAEPGDTLWLRPGVYKGNFLIDKPLTLKGDNGAILDGQGIDVTLSIIGAPDTRVEGLIIRNSGIDMTEMDAAIFLDKGSHRTVIQGNRIHARAFGIWAGESDEVLIIANRISGDTDMRSAERGDGIRMFRLTDSVIIANEIWEARDGIYIDVSHHNRLIGNILHNQRYGIHYMFSHTNDVLVNHTYDNRMGYALMMSRHLNVQGNTSVRDQNYGILLNAVTYSYLARNRSIDVMRGHPPGTPDGHGVLGTEGKAVFIYNSQHNEFEDNLFARAEIGVHLTAGSNHNHFHGNSFVGNQHQVMYVATREQEWSHEGRGNYWSDYMGWDLRGDGIGDVPYEPNDAMDGILWKYPAAKILLNSPAVQVLRWVQRQFPVLRPSGVKDSYPLIRPAHELQILEELG